MTTYLFNYVLHKEYINKFKLHTKDYKKYKIISKIFLILALIVFLRVFIFMSSLEIMDATIFWSIFGAAIIISIIPLSLGIGLNTNSYFYGGKPYALREEEKLTSNNYRMMYSYHEILDKYNQNSLYTYGINYENIQKIIINKTYSIMTIIGAAEIIDYRDINKGIIRKSKTKKEQNIFDEQTLMMNFDNIEDLVTDIKSRGILVEEVTASAKEINILKQHEKHKKKKKIKNHLAEKSLDFMKRKIKIFDKCYKISIAFLISFGISCIYFIFWNLFQSIFIESFGYNNIKNIQDNFNLIMIFGLAILFIIFYAIFYVGMFIYNNEISSIMQSADFSNTTPNLKTIDNNNKIIGFSSVPYIVKSACDNNSMNTEVNPAKCIQVISNTIIYRINLKIWIKKLNIKPMRNLYFVGIIMLISTFIIGSVFSYKINEYSKVQSNKMITQISDEFPEKEGYIISEDSGNIKIMKGISQEYINISFEETKEYKLKICFANIEMGFNVENYSAAKMVNDMNRILSKIDDSWFDKDFNEMNFSDVCHFLGQDDLNGIQKVLLDKDNTKNPYEFKETNERDIPYPKYDYNVFAYTIDDFYFLVDYEEHYSSACMISLDY